MLTRNCEIDGPEVCSKEYETGIEKCIAQTQYTQTLLFAVCETIYEEHQVEEMVPECTTTLENQCMTDEMGEVTPKSVFSWKHSLASFSLMLLGMV